MSTTNQPTNQSPTDVFTEPGGLEFVVRDLTTDTKTDTTTGTPTSRVDTPSVASPEMQLGTTVKVPHSRGYQRLSSQAPWPPAGASGPGLQPPKPLPKRPTGRFFVGAILATICATIGWLIWDACLGVAAFGVVTADTLTVVALWDGRVTELHIREGERVKQGVLMALLASSDLQRRFERLQDELHVTQAKLTADTAKMQQDAQTQTAEYFGLWATQQKSREELTRLQREWLRIQSVRIPTAVSNDERDRVRFALTGQTEFVAKSAEALEALRNRTAANAEPTTSMVSLEPTKAQIESLKAELDRVCDEIREGELRAPVTGVVVRRHAAVGQQVTRQQVVFEIVDDASIRIELFVPQKSVNEFAAGSKLNLSLEPTSRSLACEIVGSRNCFEPAPLSIERFYSSHAALQPVILKPQDDAERDKLQLGAVTRLSLLQAARWQ